MRSRVENEFNGFNDGAIFQLSDGRTWQQSRYKYKYKYAHRPEVEIRKEGNRNIMHVPCMADEIEVAEVSVVAEGAIVSDFKGFDGKSVFELSNGKTFEQAEYKYSYHYAYRPRAIVIDGLNGLTIHIEGMDESVRVRRA